MGVFKFVIGDGKKSYQVEKDQKDCPVLGKKIGNILPGDFLGLSGYELKITGGSDKDGFAMRKDIDGSIRKKFILTKGTGFHTNISGLRMRRMLCGNTIAPDIIQINCKVVRKGPASLEEILGKKEVGEPKEEKREEKKKAEAQKQETKPKEVEKDITKSKETLEKPETNVTVEEKDIPSDTKEAKSHETSDKKKEPASSDTKEEKK